MIRLPFFAQQFQPRQVDLFNELERVVADLQIHQLLVLRQVQRRERILVAAVTWQDQRRCVLRRLAVLPALQRHRVVRRVWRVRLHENQNPRDKEDDRSNHTEY